MTLSGIAGVPVVVLTLRSISSSSLCSSASLSVCWWCMKRLRTASSSCSSRRWISRFIACNLEKTSDNKHLRFDIFFLIIPFYAACCIEKSCCSYYRNLYKLYKLYQSGPLSSCARPNLLLFLPTCFSDRSVSVLPDRSFFFFDSQRQSWVLVVDKTLLLLVCADLLPLSSPGPVACQKRLLMSKRAMSRFVHLKPKIFIFVTDLKFVTTLLILNHLRTFFKSFFPLWCLFNLADDFTTVF